MGQCMEVFEGEAVSSVGQKYGSWLLLSSCYRKMGPPRGFPVSGDCEVEAPAE